MYSCETAQPRYVSLPTQAPIRSAEPTQAQEPVTLAEAKKQCEIAADVTYHDEHINRLIVGARQQVESDTGLICYTGTFTWKFTRFPAEDWFELPGIRPVTSITSIYYINTAGTSTEWTSSNYTLEPAAVQQFVRLTYGNSWPTLRGDINGVTVTMVAGYSSVLNIPPRIKQLVLQAIHREWMNAMGQPDVAARQHEAYERLLMQVTRSSYP